MPQSVTAEEIVSATNDLFREFGFHGTSMKQIAAQSKATTGSVYHFFPDGKDELTEEVIQTSGKLYQDLIESILDQHQNIAEGIAAVFNQAAELLVSTGYIDPCPIGGIAREVASIKPSLRKSVSRVFYAWTTMVCDRLKAAGVSETHAQDIAATLVAAIEGGFVLTRSHRDPQTLLRIGRSITLLIEQSLPAQR